MKMSKMKEEENTENKMVRIYQETVAAYIKNGQTEFHKGMVIGIERVLEEIGMTPFEIVRIHNEAVANPDEFSFKGYSVDRVTLSSLQKVVKND